MKCFSGALALTLVSGFMLANAALAADTGLSELETDLALSLQAPSHGEPGLFTIVKPSPTAASAVTYQLASGANPGEIRFNISDRVEEALDNPLFCFDFAADNSNAQLKLNVDSVGSQTAISGLGIRSPVQYRLTNSELVLTPPSSAQCFYRGALSNEFGLFGRPPAGEKNGNPESGPENDRLFIDGFEARMELRVSFSGWEATAAPGTKTYQLSITNAGQGDLHAVSFQEAFPSSLSVYPVRLSEGTWDCNGEGSGVGLVRVEGLPIPAGETVVCTITRGVEGTGDLRLYAAAVAAPGGNALFDVAEIEVTVE